MKNQQQAPSAVIPHKIICQAMPVPKAGRGMCAAIGAMVIAGALALPQQIRAANESWTNAPADNNWANTNNWVAEAVPGRINAITTDVATFTNAIPISGIGGASNPVTNDFDREIASLIFDGANCGAYVFGNSLDDNYLNISQGAGDSVTMGAAVANPIVFNQALRVRLPSSTNGRYNFTNNAALPTAFLYVAAFTNTSASTRPMTITLAGTNTGTNTIGHIDDQANASGAIQIFKEGPGLWILPTANDIAQKTSAGNAAGIFVEGGTLEVGDPASLGTITVGNLYVTNGVLQIDNVTLNNAGITLRSGGTIRMNGFGTVNNVTMSTITGNSATLATTSAADVMTVAAVTSGAADSVLHTAGPGTVLLQQFNTYVGNWSVDSGTCQVLSQGALGSGGNLNINAGGVFDTTPIGATSYTLDTRALSANGTGTAIGSTAATISTDPNGTFDFSSSAVTLTFKPTSFTGDTGHPALFCSRGTLAFHGNSITINNASGTPLGIGTYQLVHQASGNIASSGGFVTLVSGSGLVAGNIAEINAVGGDLNLVVSAYTPKALVWTGNDPLLPGVWDRQVSTNWLAGSTPSTYNIYDGVTFNSTGSAHPVVTLSSVMQPSSLVVDTSANDYTFGGSGQLAGGTSLVKINGGTLTLQTANTYSGGTIISNGVIKLGVDGGVSSTGPSGGSDVAIYSPAVFDLNNFTNAVNGLNGSGTIDITGGGISTLEFGFNGDSGQFTGPIQNTFGTLGIVKTGTGTETLGGSNSYVGPTLIDIGTLRVTNQYALGAGDSAVTINNGTLDMQTSLIVSNLNGGGFIINSSTATNTLTVQTDSVYSGVISGKIGVMVNAGTLQLNGANTYSNGTVIAANAGLAIGGGAANPGPGMVIASNNVTISQPNTASGSSTFAPPVTTVDGAAVTFTSKATANNWGNQFNGSASATDIFSGGNMSIGGALSFSNFLGTVVITNGGVRWFNASAGGDNTTFDFVGPTGGCFARDNVDVVHLGALFGDGAITGPSVSSPATYWIGGKGIDSHYSGTITGSNNIVKVGPGTLTFDGFTASILASDSATFTNYQYDTAISNLNSTTISNGVLALAAPNNLNSCTAITLAGPTATLDASSMGYVTNFTDLGGNPNSAIVTNGIFTVVAFNPMGAPQVLGGVGGIKGKGVVNNGTIDPGFPGVAGTLTISNALGVLTGATNNFDLSDDPSGVNAASDLLSVQGSVGLQGPSFVGIGALNGFINPGKYRLIQYTGALTNESGVVPLGPVANLSIGGAVPATTRASMVLSNGTGELDLYVLSLNTSNLVWAGDGISNWWDVVNSFNWTNNGAGTSLQFYQMDNVTFNDSATTNLAVLLQGGLAPTSITVNSASNYIFGGPGTLMGDAALIKAGTGSLTLTNGANSYNGGTVINAGVLKAGADSGANQNDLALGTGPVTVNAGGQLSFGGNGGGTVVNHFVTNAIVVNGGIVKAADGAQHLTNSTVTIAAGGGTLQTVFSGKNLILDSPLNGTGNVTIASGAAGAAGQVVLNNPTNQISGNVTIATNGNLALVGSAGLSNTVTIDVQQGGILDVLGRSNATWAVLSGQTLKGNGTIRGKSVTANAGSTVAPGIAGAIGTLTVTNNSSTIFTVLTLSGTNLMDINRASAINSDRIVNANGTNVFGGTLTVNNLGAALQAGDTFQLFVSAVNNGAFTTIHLPILTAGLTWNNTLAANGKITVVAPTTAPTISPTITNFSLSGANVLLSGTNGQAGATYYLLSTTNVALPIAQWKTIATNVAGGGNFSFTGTNAVNLSAGKQFYLLSSTNYNP